MTTNLLVIILGALIATFLVLLYRRWLPERQRQLWANALVVAALIYVAFTLVGGRWDALGLETLGVILFAMPAGLGLRYSAYFTAAGWLLHSFWDMALHSTVTTPYVPWWYPPLCLGFDVVVGVYLVGWSYWGKSNSSSLPGQVNDLTVR